MQLSLRPVFEDVLVLRCGIPWHLCLCNVMQPSSRALGMSCPHEGLLLDVMGGYAVRG